MTPSSEVVAFDDLSTGFRSNLDGVDATLVEGDDPRPRRHRRSCRRCRRGRAPRRTTLGPPLDRRSRSRRTTPTPPARSTCSRPPARAGDAHVIVASSSSVYGSNPILPKHEDLATRPMSPYAASKLATESYALAWQRSYGMPTLAFRFFNVFGPLQAAGHAYAAVVPAFVDAALRGRAAAGARRRHPVA
ncbi:MAG: NAD-dependent epimerase/dehydratase family protein [Microthrixaceae bacterium]